MKRMEGMTRTMQQSLRSLCVMIFKLLWVGMHLFVISGDTRWSVVCDCNDMSLRDVTYYRLNSDGRHISQVPDEQVS